MPSHVRWLQPEDPSITALHVAVVGAGLSGLTCARSLADRGHHVRIFEKARGPGGRMSTRRSGDWRFDHGAQYFTVRDSRFARTVESWRQDGTVEKWDGTTAVLDHGLIKVNDGTTERYVGVPGMNAVCQHLAADLEVSYQTRVESLELMNDRWRLVAEGGAELGRFDAVVISAPAPQTAQLLENVAPDIASQAGATKMAPCWAVMVGFPGPLATGFDGAFVDNSPLNWVARNASKPGRSDGEGWVLHASPEWSQRHLEIEHETAAGLLLDAFDEALGGLEATPVHLEAHRWRYALPVEALAAVCLFNRELRLAACGDWCGGPRVEGAFLSGFAAAEGLLGVQSLAEGPSQGALPDDGSECP